MELPLLPRVSADIDDMELPLVSSRRGTPPHRVNADDDAIRNTGPVTEFPQVSPDDDDMELPLVSSTRDTGSSGAVEGRDPAPATETPRGSSTRDSEEPSPAFHDSDTGAFGEGDMELPLVSSTSDIEEPSPASHNGDMELPLVSSKPSLSDTELRGPDIDIKLPLIVSSVSSSDLAAERLRAMIREPAREIKLPRLVSDQPGLFPKLCRLVLLVGAPIAFAVFHAVAMLIGLTLLASRSLNRALFKRYSRARALLIGVCVIAVLDLMSYAFITFCYYFVARRRRAGDVSKIASIRLMSAMLGGALVGLAVVCILDYIGTSSSSVFWAKERDNDAPGVGLVSAYGMVMIAFIALPCVAFN